MKEEFDENRYRNLVLNYSYCGCEVKKIGIDYDDLELFGKYKAKLSDRFLR